VLVAAREILVLPLVRIGDELDLCLEFGDVVLELFDFVVETRSLALQPMNLLDVLFVLLLVLHD